MTDFEFPGELRPAPAGVSLAITEVWNRDLIGTWPGNSLTDPHEDMPVISISEKMIDTLEGMQGEDRVNFTLAADLQQLDFAANVVVAVAFDPLKHKNAPLLFQSNLKSAPVVEQSFRTDILPKYPYLRAQGEHELWIMAQLRERTNNWKYYDGDFQQFSEFPRIGPVAVRKVKVVIGE